LVGKDGLFEKRPKHLEDIYKKIVSIVKQLGESRQETVKGGVIYFKTASTFLALKVKKDHLELEFFLDHLENMAPVSKYLHTSANRYVHIVPVNDPADIDRQLIDWIKHSYHLILSKKQKKA